jgi:hypothetical protein
MDLQELILRGRFLMSDAPERLRVFDLVNGKRTAHTISKKVKRHINSVRRDLKILENAGLISVRMDENGKAMKFQDFPVFQKDPLACTVPSRYFSQPTTVRMAPPSQGARSLPRQPKTRKLTALPIPSEQDILDIAKRGEDQLAEFKGQGTDVRKLSREIAAMLNTRQGGFIFYGIDDEGNIEGSDLTQQKLDQPLQNSVRDSISPAATVRIHTVRVLGSPVIVVVVPPWNRRDVYQWDGRILIRKGTNVFAAKPEEVRKLHAGQFVI